MQRRTKPPPGAFQRATSRVRGPEDIGGRRSGQMQPLCLPGPGTFLIAGHLRLQLHGPARR
jgi:hypothetical protein